MPEKAKENAEPDKKAQAVVNVRDVSRSGESVKETVITLSNEAAKQLQIRGEIPSRRRS